MTPADLLIPQDDGAARHLAGMSLPNIPFPAALPVASISYKDLSIQTAYVPGGQNAGNILFAWAKYSLP